MKKPPKTRSNRTSSGKKPGGQNGHEGASLSQVENPNQVVRHVVNTCGECGDSLEDKKPCGLEKRQVFDLPPLQLTVTEHQAETKRCHCGCLKTADFPVSVAAPVQYGPEVQSLAVYLNTYQFLPFSRLKEFFWDLFGVRLSPATTKRALESASEKIARTAEAIKNAVIRSALAHFDETGMRVAGVLHWHHPFNDGNGRISRIMMNAELYSQGLATIIIPNVYRSDYLSNLKAMSRRSAPENYIRMLSTAHEFSALDCSDYLSAKNLIESKNWFKESDEAKIIR